VTDTKTDKAPDFYEILGIQYRATHDEIEDAYHDLARKLHPDVTGDNPKLTARYMQVNEAYQVLSKPDNRTDYDASIGVSKSDDGSVEKSEQNARKPSTPGEDMHRLDLKLKHTIRQAEALCRSSNFWEATRMLEKFLKTHPDHAELRKALASAALGRKRYHEAVNHMKIACKVQYHDPENFVKLGRIYMHAGQLVLAEKALNEAFGWNAEHEGALILMKEIRAMRNADKPILQRFLGKVSGALKGKD